MEDYEETRVVMSPNGELLMALPIYADQSMTLLDDKEVEAITGVKKVRFGVMENFGFLIYHPGTPYAFYLKSLDLFEDLGKL